MFQSLLTTTAKKINLVNAATSCAVSRSRLVLQLLIMLFISLPVPTEACLCVEYIYLCLYHKLILSDT